MTQYIPLDSQNLYKIMKKFYFEITFNRYNWKVAVELKSREL